MSAVLLNCSSHRVPESVLEALKKRGLEQIIVVSVPFELDFSLDAPPVHKQVEHYLNKVATHPLRPLEKEGPFFLTVPGISVGAVLVATGLAARLGLYPDLIVVSRNASSNRYEYRDLVHMTEWYKNQRQWRHLQNGVLAL